MYFFCLSSYHKFLYARFVYGSHSDFDWYANCRESRHNNQVSSFNLNFTFINKNVKVIVVRTFEKLPIDLFPSLSNVRYCME